MAKKTDEITIKIKVRVKREIYDRIKEFGEEYDMPGTIEECLKQQAEAWLNHFDGLASGINDAEEDDGDADIIVPPGGILGLDGQPMGRG